MSNDFTTTLLSLKQWLTRERVAFALIGGLAAGVRGEPRFTADIDIVVSLELEAAQRLLKKLDGSEFEPLFADVEEVLLTAFILPLSHTQTKLRVDIAVGLSGFEQQLVAQATACRVADVELPVATAEDLILMKLFAGRTRDVEDVERIARIQSHRLNWKYLQTTAQQLQDVVAVDLVESVRALQQRHDKKRKI